MEDDTIPENSPDEYRTRENLWDEGWPRAEGAAVEHPREEIDNLDEQLPFPEAVGTADALEAVRDAEPYMAPIDAPVLPGGQEGIHVATGFGTSTEEEDYHEGFPRGDEEIHDEVMRVLRDDSATSKLPLDVEVERGVVRLRGQVPSVIDSEAATTLIGNVPGVVDVIDDTTIVPTAVD